MADQAGGAGAEAKKSKKPHSSDFKQQTLWAWRPILTPKTVLPTFFVIGVVFAIVGGVLFAQNAKVKEHVVEYTSCKQDALYAPDAQKGRECADLLGNFESGYTDSRQPEIQCTCTTDSFELDGYDGEDTYVYYELNNYYQNHRRYVDSRSDPQLRSKQVEATKDCDPIEYESNGAGSYNNSDAFYAPCGLIANSLFNDTIQLEKCSNPPECSTWEQMPLSGEGISWRSDRKVKFNNPDYDDNTEFYQCQVPGWRPPQGNMLPPPNWPVHTCLLGANARFPVEECKPFGENNAAGSNYSWPGRRDEADICDHNINPSDSAFYNDTKCCYNPWSSRYGSSGAGYLNEDLIVWMRTAALPNFRKFYRKAGSNVLEGTYRYKIGYNYPVVSFSGKKKIVISTTSSVGGKNAFLGIAYLVVGVLAIAAGIAFLVAMAADKNDRSNPDIANMKW